MSDKCFRVFVYANSRILSNSGVKANALNNPPEQYSRKAENQRNCRDDRSAVDDEV